MCKPKRLKFQKLVHNVYERPPSFEKITISYQGHPAKLFLTYNSIYVTFSGLVFTPHVYLPTSKMLPISSKFLAIFLEGKLLKNNALYYKGTLIIFVKIIAMLIAIVNVCDIKRNYIRIFFHPQIVNLLYLAARFVELCSKL